MQTVSMTKNDSANSGTLSSYSSASRGSPAATVVDAASPVVVAAAVVATSGAVVVVVAAAVVALTTRNRRKCGSVSRQKTMIEMRMTTTDASASTRAAVELSGYSTNSQTFHANARAQHRRRGDVQYISRE